MCRIQQFRFDESVRGERREMRPEISEQTRRRVLHFLLRNVTLSAPDSHCKVQAGALNRVFILGGTQAPV